MYQLTTQWIIGSQFAPASEALLRLVLSFRAACVGCFAREADPVPIHRGQPLPQARLFPEAQPPWTRPDSAVR